MFYFFKQILLLNSIAIDKKESKGHNLKRVVMGIDLAVIYLQMVARFDELYI